MPRGLRRSLRTFFLSLFPALLFLVALASFFPLYSFTDELMRLLAPIAPAAVVNLLQDQLTSLSNSEDAGLLSIGLLMALWSSSAAMVSIIDAMNRAYDIEDSRAWWKRRLIAIALDDRAGALHPDVIRAHRRGTVARRLSRTPFRARARVRAHMEDSSVASGLSSRLHRLWTRVLLRPRRRTGMGVDYPGRARSDLTVAARFARVPLLRRELRQLRRGLRHPWRDYSDPFMVLHHRSCDGDRRRAQRRDPSCIAVGQKPRTAVSSDSASDWVLRRPASGSSTTREVPIARVTKSRTPTCIIISAHSRSDLCSSEGMEHITFDFLLGFLLAVGLMVALWVPLFFFDYKAEKKRGSEPIGSGENPPTPPLDKVHLN